MKNVNIFISGNINWFSTVFITGNAIDTGRNSLPKGGEERPTDWTLGNVNPLTTAGHVRRPTVRYGSERKLIHVVTSLSQHHSFLLSLAWRRIAPPLRTIIEPEDLVQETFLHAIRTDQRTPFAGKTVDDFRRWLGAIMRNRIVDAIRKANAAKRGPCLTPRLPPGFDCAGREMDPARLVELMEGSDAA